MMTNCTNCGKSFEAQAACPTDYCPYCGHETAVDAAPIPATPPEMKAQVDLLHNILNKLPNPKPGAVVRAVAGRFVVAAKILMGLAILVFGVTLIKALAITSQGSYYVAELHAVWMNGLAGTVGLVTTAGWLYLVGQIIHLRANTEK